MNTVDLLQLALEEDCPDGDITSTLVVPKDQDLKADLISKESGLFFGAPILEGLYGVLFKDSCRYTLHKKDGASVSPGDIIATIEGSCKTILKTERILLNFCQRLSGVTTQTKRFVDTLNNPKIKILDTRKTTPTHRSLERMAVLAGGGVNHRSSLSDMVLIKENHWASLIHSGRMSVFNDTCRTFKLSHPSVKIESEIENIQQIKDYPLEQMDIILLDNFILEDIPKAIKIAKDRGLACQFEVSGNINLGNIHLYQEMPIQRISIGSLTHSINSLDISLLF